MSVKYLFILGGVMSGVGKGVASASIGYILKSRGYRVSAVKIDPYINVDAGTMNPTEHGEVFVTHDGDETDQDIGNYERFLDQYIPSINYMTTGRVYQKVIEKERNLEYGGKCVEVVPHIPMEVFSRLKKAAQESKADILIVEIGGTVGEYQNILFLEAARMMHAENPKDVAFVLVSYLPVPGTIGEMKTKPTQYAIRTVNSSGIQPDFILARAVQPLDKPRKQKIARVASIDEKRVISSPDVNNIYEIPLDYYNEGLDLEILRRFDLSPAKAHLNDWREFIKKIKRLEKVVKIGIVGKYFQSGEFTLSDSYISVIEAIKHAAWFCRVKPDITWLNSEDYEKGTKKLDELKNYNAIIVPGGYGSRGIEGKIKAIEFIRTKSIPFLGICYGMQMATVEYARNVLGLKDAHTTEINPQTKNPVIHTMQSQIDKIAKKEYGGTMRLGAYPCRIDENSIVYGVYKKTMVEERHRHRYEFNNKYREEFEKKGFMVSGICPDNGLVEIIELSKDIHPYFVGVQFHPEFLSRPLCPHPVFRGLIEATQK